MQVDLAVFGFVPFRIEQQILSVEQFLNLSSVESFAIRNGLMWLVFGLPSNNALLTNVW
jgi:hypothetical protein